MENLEKRNEIKQSCKQFLLTELHRPHPTSNKCCRYHFREYITKGLERNSSEILGKILENNGKNELRPGAF